MNEKSAYLVTFAPTTRVVVKTFGKSKEESENEAIEAAIAKILASPEEYINFENLDWIETDKVCPANENE